MVVLAALTFFQPSLRKVRIPVGHRLGRNGRGGGSGQDQRADVLIHEKQFVNAHAPLVAQLPALLATGPFAELGGVDFILRESDALQVGALRLFARLRTWDKSCAPNRRASTASTDEAHQERLNAHVDQTREGAGALLVCNVLKTRWPVNAARIAISAVSRSRISPTMMTLGSWRKMWRKPMGKVRPISARTEI